MGLGTSAANIVNSIASRANQGNGNFSAQSLTTPWKPGSYALVYQPTAKRGASPTSSATNYASNALQSGASATLKALQDQLAKLGQARVEAPVWIPSVNFKDIWARSRSAAESAVNPYYQKELEGFLAQRNLERKTAQETFVRANQDYATSLNKFLEDAAINRGRTTEDVKTKLGQITEDEALRQKGEAQQFDIGRRGLQEGLAQAGTTFSGLGRQQLQQAGQQRKLTETAATTQVQRSKAEQRTFEERTLADLAKGEVRKKEETELGKQRAKMDLDLELENILYNEQSGMRNLEYDRMSKIWAEEERQNQLAFRNYLSGLKTAKQIERAKQLYGNTF